MDIENIIPVDHNMVGMRGNGKPVKVTTAIPKKAFATSRGQIAGFKGSIAPKVTNSKCDEVRMEDQENGVSKPQPLKSSSNVNAVTRTRTALGSTTSVTADAEKRSLIPRARLEATVSAPHIPACKEEVPPAGDTYPTNIQVPIRPPHVEDIDQDDEDPQLVSAYVNDIYAYLRELEISMPIRPQHLDKQREMTHKMRAILVDWIINVQSSFKLMPETLYLSISIMDRFFQRENVAKDKIQLVGVTSCWIASKFEEIYPPDISDYVHICDRLYTKKDIIKMEMTILKTLKFNLCRPIPLHFLRRNSKAIKADTRIHSLAKYLMETTLVEYTTCHWSPSLLAATSLYLTAILIAPDRTWDETMEFYSGYKEDELKPFALQMIVLLKNAEKSRYQSCRKKYSSERMLSVSKLPQLSAVYLEDISNSLIK